VLTAGCPCGHLAASLGGSTSRGCRFNCSRRSSQLLAVSPPLLCRRRLVRSIAGLYWSLRLPHRAVRGAQVVACAVLSAWLSLAELCAAVSLSPVVAVRHSLIGRRGFGARQVIASVALELGSTTSRRAVAADRFRLSLPRCGAGCVRSCISRRCSCYIRRRHPMAATGVACAASCYAVVIVVVHCCLA
jgi:hypothetical protein